MQEFTNQWNNYMLSTERHQSPYQLWTKGILSNDPTLHAPPVVFIILTQKSVMLLFQKIILSLTEQQMFLAMKIRY